MLYNSYLHTRACWFTDEEIVSPQPTRITVGGEVDAEGTVVALLCLYRENGITAEIRLDRDTVDSMIARLIGIYHPEWLHPHPEGGRA